MATTVRDSLYSTARALVAPGKGILAADESSGTIRKRLAGVEVESTEETRRAYRDLLLSAAGMEDFISGVILFEETLQQRTSEGIPFPEALTAKGVIPGIKVDKGAKDFAAHPGEKVTDGLDGLRERLSAYREQGARFAKWRAVITIEGDHLPTVSCLRSNAEALGRYAALCQEAGLVPIVEPEVLMTGNHSIERCEAVTEETLRTVFAALATHRVELEGILLKPSMVIAGQKADPQADVAEVATATLRCLRRTVPAAVPGLVFLSGGQSPELATAHLNEMNRRGSQPWELSFSYGRALQEPALAAWRGNAENVRKAQSEFLQRARLNHAARKGQAPDE